MLQHNAFQVTLFTGWSQIYFILFNLLLVPYKSVFGTKFSFKYRKASIYLWGFRIIWEIFHIQRKVYNSQFCTPLYFGWWNCAFCINAAIKIYLQEIKKIWFTLITFNCKFLSAFNWIYSFLNHMVFFKVLFFPKTEVHTFRSVFDLRIWRHYS